MNSSDLIVLALLLAAVGLAVYLLRRQKRRGGCYGCCGGSCAACGKAAAGSAKAAEPSGVK